MLLRLRPKPSPLGWRLHHPWSFSSAMGGGRGRAYEHHGSVRRPGLRSSPRSAHLAEVLSCQERCERAQKARHTPSQTPRMTPCCRGPSLTSLACHSGLSQPGCILFLPLPPVQPLTRATPWDHCGSSDGWTFYIWILVHAFLWNTFPLFLACESLSYPSRPGLLSHPL